MRRVGGGTNIRKIFKFNLIVHLIVWDFQVYYLTKKSSFYVHVTPIIWTFIKNISYYLNFRHVFVTSRKFSFVLPCLYWQLLLLSFEGAVKIFLVLEDGGCVSRSFSFSFLQSFKNIKFINKVNLFLSTYY